MSDTYRSDAATAICAAIVFVRDLVQGATVTPTPQQLEAKRAEWSDAKEALDRITDELHKMELAVSAAEREAEVRKARKMTPTMKALLQKLVDGDKISVYHPWGSRPPRYSIRAKVGCPSITVNSGLVDRLFTAGYIDHESNITDAGREALAKAKEKQ